MREHLAQLDELERLQNRAADANNRGPERVGPHSGTDAASVDEAETSTVDEEGLLILRGRVDKLVEGVSHRAVQLAGGDEPHLLALAMSGDLEAP